MREQTGGEEFGPTVASVSMVMAQKGSRGPTGTRPVLPAPGQWGDPGENVNAGPDDYKDFLVL